MPRTKNVTAGPSRSRATEERPRQAAATETGGGPKILTPSIPRYNTLYYVKFVKVERRINFEEMAPFGLREMLESAGMMRLVDEVWQSTYCNDFALAFVAHLKFLKSSKSFSSMVQDVKFLFSATSVCRQLGLPLAGLDVFSTASEETFTKEEYMDILFGRSMGEPYPTPLNRAMLPPRMQVLSYLCHHNILPRGGKANSELPHYHIQMICALAERRPINFVPIIEAIFKKLARTNLSFMAYHKLITYMCKHHNLDPEDFEFEDVQGDILDKKKLVASRIEVPSSDSEDEGEEEGGDEHSSDETLAHHTEGIRSRSRADNEALHKHMDDMEARLMNRIDGLEALIRRDRGSAPGPS